MGITYGDHLIDSGHYDITPEQEREIEAREECARRGIDPDELCADGGIEAWMVVAQEIAQRPRAIERPGFSEHCNCYFPGDCDGSCAHPEPTVAAALTKAGSPT